MEGLGKSEECAGKHPLPKSGKSEQPSKGMLAFRTYLPPLMNPPLPFPRSSSDRTSGSVPSTPPRTGENERPWLGGKRPGAEVPLKERSGAAGGGENRRTFLTSHLPPFPLFFLPCSAHWQTKHHYLSLRRALPLLLSLSLSFMSSRPLSAPAWTGYASR